MKNETVFIKIKNSVKKLNIAVLILTGLFLSSSTFAVSIAKTPLFLNQSAPPNIMFVLDDSGSMDWDILTVPHFDAMNYDSDFNRSWAKGGWFNTSYTSQSKRKNGDWRSYAGNCGDRNADGICYNRHDLNGDGDDTDSEFAPVGTSTLVYRLRLWHLYHWNYLAGKCDMPSAGGTDASDFLPNIGNVFASLTGIKEASAHSYSGTSWGGSNHASNQNTSPNYDNENWKHDGVANTYNLADPVGQAAAEATCVSNGGTWNKNGTLELIHQGANPWVSAGSVNATTGVYDISTRNVGDYHQEYPYSTGSAASTDELDINGDGDYGDDKYHEQDSWGATRIVYRYMDESKDNVYLNSRGPFGDDSKPWETCQKERNETSVNSCQHLQSPDYPAGYDYDPLNPAVAATSPWLRGNENIETLPDFVPRAIKASWGNPPSTEIRFDTIPWVGGSSPAGTRHAMNRWDAWPTITDWRIRSASFNVLYYSPETQYTPWPGLVEGSFNAAKSNPQPGSVGYTETIDLVRPHGGDEGGFVYAIWHDDAGFWSDKPQWHTTTSCGTSGWRASGNGITGMLDPATGIALLANDRVCSTYHDQPNKIVDLWDKRDRVTVYSNKIVVQTVRRTPHIMGEQISASNPTQKRFISDTRILNTVTYNAGTTYPVDGFCETVLGRDPNNTANCRTVAQVQQNAANWFEFSRRRSFVAKGAIASLMKKIDAVNYGLMATSRNDTVGNNKTNETILSADISQMFRDVYDEKGSGNGDSDRPTHNAALQETLYNHVFRKSGTPLRQALQRTGEYFAGRGPDFSGGAPKTDPDNHSTSPITEACQKNFAIMLTDGYWSGLDPIDVLGEDASGAPVALNNADGDVYNKTLADVAKYYYDEDLSAEDNKVPTDTFDTNNAQHLTTIGIGFGVTGSLADGNDNGWPGSVTGAGGSSHTENSTWGGDPDGSNQQYKIDDLWHAAYNSRGLYLSASNPTELLDSLEEAIFFALKETGSASSLTVNNDFSSEGATRLYQTIFRSGEWSGDVLSLKRDASGDFTIVDWSGQNRLRSIAYGSRKIFTLDASGANAVPFRFANLSVPQQNAMKVRQVTGASDLDGDMHVNYLRGDSTNEGTIFRKRADNKLGDIVHSAVLRVDVPNASYPDDWGVSQPENGAAYSEFKALHNPPTPGIPRPVMLFVGANDGMLHAFDAETGDEKYAYIPKALIPKLNYLSHLPSAAHSFKHQFYVDDTPVSSDAFFAGSWHTVLVGGLRGGGRAIYALDISTVPTTGTETSIGNAKHLWEFTHTNPAPYGDPDLGFTFSRPQIARLANGKWVAIFGNGYQDDATGKAVLYIVNLEDGKLIRKIVADGADIDNGLSSPSIVDVNRDYVADFVYAGDLKGNLWRFDLTDPLPANWGVSFGGAPLFVAHETGSVGSKQPITVAPTIEVHPRGLIAGHLVSFGTGQYMEPTDNNVAGEKTQTLYTIWDYDRDGTPAQDFDRNDLLIQSVLFQDVSGARATSAKGVDWMDTGHNIGDSGWEDHIDDTGWYIDLTFKGNNEGERQVNKALTFGKFITFDSLIPSNEACTAGGGSRRYILDRESGANYLGEPQDLNGDGNIDADEAAAFQNAIYTKEFSYDDGNARVPNYATGEFDTILDKSGGGPVPADLPIISKGERRSWIQLD